MIHGSGLRGINLYLEPLLLKSLKVTGNFRLYFFIFRTDITSNFELTNFYNWNFFIFGIFNNNKHS